MVRKITDVRVSLRLELLLTLLLLFAATASIMAGGGPRNVLVVQNSRSTISKNIAAYYVSARGIPPENICTIDCATTELVDYTECEASIVAPIRAFLQNPDIGGRIDYIVLTKGIPLGAYYKDPTYNPPIYYDSGPLSITSVLTCLSEPSVTKYIKNPYGPNIYPPVEAAFSHQTALNGLHLYLVTRLDGYTQQDVYGLIDRSVMAQPVGAVALDRASPPPYINLNDKLKNAMNILTNMGVPVIYDDTSTFLGGMSGLIGYFSWGSNDSAYNATAYKSNIFLPGSIAGTFVSTSGRTFCPTTGGQSLIADLIPLGACGLECSVSEPYTSAGIWPDVLFDRYTKGYNMAESMYMASPKLFWKSVVVGDPLMAPFATKPYVALDSVDTPFTGQATISAIAIDPEGIKDVDFYFDGKYVASSTQSPYGISIDTTNYTVGPHKVEVVAIDASPVAAQGYTAANINVQNPISNLSRLSDAFPSPDGQGVATPKSIVTAGTVEMGGSEFYIRDENGCSGLRVESSQVVNRGDVVTLLAGLVTRSGERSVTATQVNIVDHVLTEPRPVMMPNKAVGGADFTSETEGVTGGRGLRNIGLLIRTWGKVTYTGTDSEDYFYIDDGSNLSDGCGHKGLRVGSRKLPKPPLYSKVVVTGLSSCEEIGDRVIPVIKPRTQNDITMILL
ncbi:MAG: TIGR03790 family protein [Armatimonadetes bacterium]|nr:TIGR03790 family protein [Armatimonadota bacterium]